MQFLDKRIATVLKDLKNYTYPKTITIPEILTEKEGEWVPFPAGGSWGGYDLFVNFKTQITIPAEFTGKKAVFRVRTGREGTWNALNPQFVITVNGNIVQGLDTNHTEITLSEKAVEGATYDIHLAAYSGRGNSQAELTCYLSILDTAVDTLYYHIKTPLDVALLLDGNDKRRIDIIEYLNDAVNLIDLRVPYSPEYHASVKEAVEFLETEFYGKYCGKSDITVLCVGHTHIDVAWQWTLAQTRKKTVRSFATVLNLMKQYPEYVFMSSQPQLYKFLKEEEPTLYEEVKQRVKEGRWEPEGAMWLEADCNLASGEALVRQVMFGKEFFRREFGVENKLLWLPDVFGYNAALPQILKKSDVDYFITSKISWNDTNKLPCDTFLWKGLDGTEIFSYFLTASNYNAPANQHFTTYNAVIDPNQIMGSYKRFQQKNLTDEVLVCYGHGDGGGGPTKEMLETGRRLEKGIPGCPVVKQGKVYDFIKRLEEKTKGDRRLPKWDGELYLEAHRGTYTSMGRIKKFNRKSELLYLDAELFSVMNNTLTGGTYEQEKLDAGWETILLNQFHDILPGSSIKDVYDDATKDYERVLANGNAVAETALQSITSKIKTEGDSVVLFNSLYFNRSDITEVEGIPAGHSLADSDGTVLASQSIDGKTLIYAKNIPAKGYKTFRLVKVAASKTDAVAPTATKDTLSNRFFTIKLDDGGNIVSLFHKRTNREVIKSGERANLFTAYEDKPVAHDVWDIENYYTEKSWNIDTAESIEVVEQGALRASVRIKRSFLSSTIEQEIRIYRDIDRIDFVTTIDWKQQQILLKTAFPVDVQGNKATYDIQFGNVERPTHHNTSWDAARFEVCAHKWADLSEEGYGVSLLNDCKYGHSIKDGVMCLTLLKSGIYPFPNADKEIHTFTYSLYPHLGGWRTAGTEKMAYTLNTPLYASLESAHDGTLPQTFSLISTDSENVVLETVKKAQSGDDYIVRMFEAHNKRSTVTVNFGHALEKVIECNLMEKELAEVPTSGNRFTFEMKPYEIKTFKLKRN